MGRNMLMTGYDAPVANVGNLINPLMQGLQNYRQGMQQQAEGEIRREQMGMERERMGMQRARMARADQKDDADIIGEAASSFAQLPPEQRNPAAWDRVLRRHPEYNGLGPEYRDPVNGPALVAAEYGKYKAQRPEAPELRTVGNALVSIPPRGQPQVVYQAPDKANPVDEMIMRRLGGGGQAPAQRQYQPMPPGGPRLQQQSSTGEVMPGGVTLANDPATPEMPAAPQPRMVDTPFGRMGVDEARELGGTMLLSPRFAQAGRALLDSIGSTANPSNLQNPTLNAIEEKQLNTTESLSRLNSIAKQFKPEFQTFENRIGYAWSNLIDKFSTARNSLKPEEQRQLAEFSAYRADALNNLNQYIKEITGAAMTNAEANRIMKAMPNPGEGIFDGDGPIDFQSKLGAAMRTSKLALARYNYIKRNGLNGKPLSGPLTVNGKDTELGKQLEEALPLEQMGGVIKRRQMEIGREVISRNPQVGIEQLMPVIRQRLAAEFGVDA